MSQKLNYESLLRDASISVVKQILEQVAKIGFNNEQHLYITFSLKHPDVQVSDNLKEEFDDELTIVLQYEFWDLSVDDHGFSVSLAFDSADEHIYVPFASLIEVSDPSEDFTLKFIPNFADIKVDTKIKEEISQSNIISLDAFRHRN